ncbi:glycosyltransferase [Methylobacterium sp. WL69]|uniref:glycosyltransferase n=1 Tax=Methylobacterium sp. WL69 TaxID=2603893 RepID=UPI0011C70A6C|nr:glycosyltransferase [Methylobacterium sp. WL69]TXM70113.1 glycosyltransferase [Methylobacterium sp. WL69]
MLADPGALSRAVVCVPARNEAAILSRLIRSLDAQAGASPETPLRVLVLANNCTDETVPALRALERDGIGGNLRLRVVEARIAPPEAHVGTARRMALDAGIAWLRDEGVVDGVLLSTDADAVALSGWALANLRALESADLVGGRLVIDPEAERPDPDLADLHARIERYWIGVRALEDLIDPPPHDPAPRHGDHVAASLALRVDLYESVGGLPALACGEDNALVSLVRRAGGRVRHCPAVSIAVSDRAAGRVEGGMATEMLRRSRVAGGHESYRLPPADHWRALIERRRDWRLAWEAGPDWATALRRLGIDAGIVGAMVAEVANEPCPNAIAFVERLAARVGEPGPEPAPQPLDDVLADLEALWLKLARRGGDLAMAAPAA